MGSFTHAAKEALQGACYNAHSLSSHLTKPRDLTNYAKRTTLPPALPPALTAKRGSSPVAPPIPAGLLVCVCRLRHERRGNVWFEWFFTKMHARPCEARTHTAASRNASGAVSAIGSSGISRTVGASAGGNGGGGSRSSSRAIGLIDESIALQTFQRRLVPEIINVSSAHGAVLTTLARDDPKLSASLSVTVDACLAFPRVPRACPGMLYRYVAGTQGGDVMRAATGDAGGVWVHVKRPSKPKRKPKPKAKRKEKNMAKSTPDTVGIR